MTLLFRVQSAPLLDGDEDPNRNDDRRSSGDDIALLCNPLGFCPATLLRLDLGILTLLTPYRSTRSHIIMYRLRDKKADLSLTSSDI